MFSTPLKYLTGRSFKWAITLGIQIPQFCPCPLILKNIPNSMKQKLNSKYSNNRCTHSNMPKILKQLFKDNNSLLWFYRFMNWNVIK